ELAGLIAAQQARIEVLENGKPKASDLPPAAVPHGPPTTPAISSATTATASTLSPTVTAPPPPPPPFVSLNAPDGKTTELMIGGTLPGVGTGMGSLKVRSKESKPSHRRSRSGDGRMLNLDEAPNIDDAIHSDSEKHPRPLSQKPASSSSSSKQIKIPLDFHPPLPNERAAVVRKGDLHFGTRYLGKRLWHRRSFILFKDGWLAFREKRSQPQEMVAWIYIPRCKIFKKRDRQLLIVARSLPLFYPHPGVKASKKFGSSSCTLRTADESSTDGWWDDFVRIPPDSSITDMDLPIDDDSSGDDDDVDLYSERSAPTATGSSSSSSSYQQPPHFSFTDDTVSSLTSSTSHQPTDAHRFTSVSESNIPDKRLRRQESLLIRAPDAAAPVEVPLAEASEEKQGLFEMLKKAVGSDLTTMSMPISVHEPTSFLQRMAETLQYHHLLEAAGSTTDPVRQCMLTAVFAVVAYSCNVRTQKPFNPYLGETYQYDDGNVRFFAEQVSHHPPIGACVLDASQFTFFQDMCVQTKFGGNNLDVTPSGEWHVVFKNNGNHFTWKGQKTVVNSIIIGTMWIDCFGETEVISVKTGEKAKIKMTKCGWFSKGRWETTIKVFNSRGKEALSVSGKWNSELRVDGTDEVVWTNTLGAPRQGDKYQRPDHVFELIDSPPALIERLPPTDSRFRKDVIALQSGDTTRASAEKKALEERERALRRQRTVSGIEFRPQWFSQAVPPDSLTGEPMWLFNGEYWKNHGSPDTNARLGFGDTLFPHQ
ncbi:MAG: OSBP family protein, partial [archaeon]|nr:OSBP family protein [archaeon]